MSLYRHTSSPHKKAGLRHRLGLLLFIVLLLCGASAAFFLVFLRGYVMDTPTGPRLQLPVFGTVQPKAEASAVFGDTDALHLPDVPRLKRPLHAILLPNELLLEGDISAALQQAGGNAAIFDMRADDGSLSYVSEIPLAIEAFSSAASPAWNEAILAANRSPDLYTIARVSCFSDPLLSKLSPALCLQRPGGVPYRDTALNPWLDPSNAEAQAYLLALLREISALGFDEILLSNCAYPTQGAKAQQFIGNEDHAALAQNLEGFYREVGLILQEQGVALSLLWEPSTAASAQLPPNGQSPEMLLPLCDRVWFADERAAASVFASRGLSSASLSLVPILDKTGNISSSWAKF